MEEQESPRLGFVPSRLPWLVALGALVLYLVTLAPWVNLGSLTVAAKVIGWDWSPALNSPLHFLVTLPVRWLPATWQIPALNAFSAVFAACSLALLARCVALLPHDRTVEQRAREHNDFSLLSIRLAWIPPLLAVAACGLQLTFWENATSSTGEMLDLLLFAYVLRCLLEYRIDERDGWLYKLALVYGAGVTNNWALIGFVPLFTVALVLMRGRSFFNLRFLLRMFGLGLAGMLLYLLLPLLASFADGDLHFGKLLLTELGNQKGALLGVPRSSALVLALTSILPVVFLSIRWPSSFGDTSVLGTLFSNLMFRLVHAMLFGACLWISFDPAFGPRMLGGGLPFLSFHFLAALSVGYFGGYFLLMAVEPAGRGRLRASALSRLTEKALAGLVILAAIATPAGLAIKNHPVLRLLNGGALKEFATQLSETIPANDAVILSDNPYLLNLVQAVRHPSGGVLSNSFVETRMMNFALYQMHLQRLQPKLWPELPAAVQPKDSLNQGFLSQQIASLAATRELHYLHPSFGYYFESVFQRQSGLSMRLSAYGTNTLGAPSLKPDEIQKTEDWFTRHESSWMGLSAITRDDFPTARVLAEWYSRALNQWGVELQRHGRLDEAGKRFSQAATVNTNNFVAALNLQVNGALKQGIFKSLGTNSVVERGFAELGGFDSVLTAYGPFDEAQFCHRQARVLAQNGLNRQAAIAFKRSIELDPSNLRAQIEFAAVCVAGEAYKEGLAALTEVRRLAPSSGLSIGDDFDVSRLEAMVYNARGDVAKAEEILTALCRKYPKYDAPMANLAEFYAGSGRFKDAARVLDEQIALNPENLVSRFYRGIVSMRLEAYDEALATFDLILRKQPANPDVLLNKAVVYIQTKRHAEAIPVLNEILRNQPDHKAALMNRAIASLQSEQLDQASRDYAKLESALPDSHAVCYGLGTIAWKRKEAPAAIRHYERYLELLKKQQPDAPLTEEAKEVRVRLAELQAPQR
jgi:tetratricopeptide (TPR) repeat protein